jgi:nonsense-mediated mRNA decay protein 3
VSYCVECGKEATLGKLCASCFDKKHELVRVPENVDITLCAHCGGHQRGPSWVRVDKLEAVQHALEGAIEVDASAKLDVLDVNLREEDKKNYTAELQFIFKIDNTDFRREGRTRVRIKQGVCGNCSKQKGMYFEAVLQVRPPERGNEELVEQAAEIVRSEVDRAADEVFVSKEESMHGGVDFYLSSKGAGKSIAKLLQSRFGGEVTTSSRLQGQKDGRDVYRMTFLFRFPAFGLGSVLKLAGKLFQVVSLGPPMAIADLATLQERSVMSGELRSATKVEAETLTATIVSREEKEVQVLDPETMRTVTLLRPPGVEDDAEEMLVVKTPDGVHPSYLQRIN